MFYLFQIGTSWILRNLKIILVGYFFFWIICRPVFWNLRFIFLGWNLKTNFFVFINFIKIICKKKSKLFCSREFHKFIFYEHQKLEVELPFFGGLALKNHALIRDHANWYCANRGPPVPHSIICCDCAKFERLGVNQTDLLWKTKIWKNLWSAIGYLQISRYLLS